MDKLASLLKKLYNITFKLYEVKVLYVCLRSLLGFTIYAIFFLVFCNRTLSKITLFDWPLRQKASDFPKFYENQEEKEIAFFINEKLFGVTLSAFDLVIFFINWGIVISSSIRLVRNPKHKFYVSLFLLIKDVANLVLIFISMKNAKLEKGFNNFLLFSLTTIFKESFITLLLNMSLRSYILLDLCDYNELKYLRHMKKVQKVFIVFFFFSISAFIILHIIMIPYLFCGIAFIIPIITIWFIPAGMAASIFVLPFYKLYTWYYNREESKISDERRDLDGYERHYIIKDEKSELNEKKVAFQIATSLKIIQIIYSLSLYFAAMMLNGFNLARIYSMFFSISFMSFNLYTIQYTELKDKFQYWLNEFLNLF